ncbi:MAG: AMP-binding protein [Lachnospiraceae bacterium]|nr:AMP-binding protein [Lachnospiraceae bacterium]
MSLLYEDYYQEIKDGNGKICEIRTTYGRHFNFAYDVVDRFAKEDPEKLAMVHKSAEGVTTRVTFGELMRRSNQAANVFFGLGIRRHDSVMLLCKRRLEYWIAILALHKMGAVAIPTSHMVSAKDIEERGLVSHMKAVVCVNSEHICANVLEGTKNLDVVNLVIGDEFPGMLPFAKLLEGASDVWERVDTDVEDDMLYYFTSGTSGAPKAVIHDFSYPIAHIYTAKNWHGMQDGDLHLTVADTGWAKSAWGKLYGQWFVGAAIMVYDYEQFYAGDLLKVLEEEGVNTFCAPPTIYKYLVLEDVSKVDLSKLRHVSTAGEPMPREVARKFKEMTGLTVREGFGQTETALQICTDVSCPVREGSLGKASPLYHMELVDEDGNQVAPGEEGEIVILPDGLNQKDDERFDASTSKRGVPRRTPLGILKGYLGDDTLYEDVWKDGVYHTRDKAKMDSDGYFYFVGRNDDVIKSSGYRIGPSEVEDLLMKHPAVFECAVTAYPSRNRGALVKATIILRPGYEKTQQLKTQLQDFVKERAAIYKYPRRIEFVDELPRTSNGKISRAMIRKKDYGLL